MAVKERLDRHDRQIAAIRDLVQQGMRLVVDTRKDLREVIAIQKRTEQKLETLIKTMKRGPNGHPRKNVDVQ